MSSRNTEETNIHFESKGDDFKFLHDTSCLFPKKLIWSNVIQELLWSIQGNTNSKLLADKGVNIWNTNGSRQFLDSCGFTSRHEGDLGPIHGHQWRHWGANYKDFQTDYSGQGIDQLSQVIEKIKTNPNDRRLIVCAWNVSDIPLMAFPPCHCLFQFCVNKGKLSCLVYQASGDVGVHFNLASCALLTHMIAHVTNLEPETLINFIGDARMEPQEMKLDTFPTLTIKRKISSIDNFKSDDFELIDNEVKFNFYKILCPPERPDFCPQLSQYSNHDEKRYLDVVQFILDNGTRKDDRTGVGTISRFGVFNSYSLSDDTLPLLTTKRVYWKGVLEELLWFIGGNTDSKSLAAKGVHIWDANGSRSFLDNLGFTEREEGDLGPVYGHQWRHWGSEYKNCKTDYSGQGIDQLSNIIERIKINPDDRRLIVCAWNVTDIPLMALPPCHCLFQLIVNNGQLNCILYQRSGDIGLGVPFNIASYSLLTHMVAHLTNLQPGQFYHFIGDAHIYLNHVDPLKIQLTREPRPFPKLKIQRKVETIDDFKCEDFELIGYKPHPKLEMEMAV